MTTPRQPIADPHAGISLVEVIMYSTLTVLVLTVVASLFYVGFQTQAVAGDRDTATGHAQLVANTLQSGVGNASAISVTGSSVQARVATGTAGWQCAAWVVTDDQKLVYRTSDSPITDTNYGSWTLLATGVSGGLSGGEAFSGTANQLDYSLRFASGSVTVPIAGAVAATAFGPGSPESCW